MADPIHDLLGGFTYYCLHINFSLWQWQMLLLFYFLAFTFPSSVFLKKYILVLASLLSMGLLFESFWSFSSEVFAAPVQTLLALKVQNKLPTIADENCNHLTSARRRESWRKTIKVTIYGKERKVIYYQSFLKSLFWYKILY